MESGRTERRLGRWAGVLALAMLAAALAQADPVWIDVRSPEEYAADHIAGDPNIPYLEVAGRIESLTADRDAEIVLYCRSGGRAAKARKSLLDMGYTKVRNAGGIADARHERGLDAPDAGQ